MVARLIFAGTFMSAAFAAPTAEKLGLDATSQIASLDLPKNDTKVAAEFTKVYDNFLASFDVDGYTQLLKDMEQVGFKNFQNSKAYNAYRSVPGQPHCDRGVPSSCCKSAGNQRYCAFPWWGNFASLRF